MASMFDVELRGTDQAIRHLGRAEKAISPSDGLKTVMTVATGMLHRYVIGQPREIMRVKTGRLRNSIFPDVRNVRGETVGLVATNVEYAPPVEKRYGFFARGIANQQPVINSLFTDHVGKVI